MEKKVSNHLRDWPNSTADVISLKAPNSVPKDPFLDTLSRHHTVSPPDLKRQ